MDRDGDVMGGTLKALLDAGITDIPVLDIDHVNVGPWIRNTLTADKNKSRDEALIDIYRVMRPGEPPTRGSRRGAVRRACSSIRERYDLSAVGRVKMNMRLGLDARRHRSARCATRHPRRASRRWST